MLQFLGFLGCRGSLADQGSAIGISVSVRFRDPVSVFVLQQKFAYQREPV